jgi:GNAT superfamily N-acetyltransferase
MTERLEVRSSDPFAPEAVRLIGELWRELGTLYPEVQGTPFHPADISGKRTAFVVAWLDEAAVGCGAFKPFTTDNEIGMAEIKRMYVQPSARCRGIARAILMKLEQLASDCGYELARLESGKLQPDAIHLYKTSGYREIEPYGRYAEDPLSICFEKSL